MPLRQLTPPPPPPPRRQVNLWRVAECVVRLTRPLVKEKVQLLNCVPRDMPPAKSDSTRLMQARVFVWAGGRAEAHLGKRSTGAASDFRPAQRPRAHTHTHTHPHTFTHRNTPRCCSTWWATRRASRTPGARPLRPRRACAAHCRRRPQRAAPLEKRRTRTPPSAPAASPSHPSPRPVTPSPVTQQVHPHMRQRRGRVGGCVGCGHGRGHRARAYAAHLQAL